MEGEGEGEGEGGLRFGRLRDHLQEAIYFKVFKLSLYRGVVKCSRQSME